VFLNKIETLGSEVSRRDVSVCRCAQGNTTAQTQQCSPRYQGFTSPSHTSHVTLRLLYVPAKQRSIVVDTR
jgi:hypothetical protein